jgi:hypothetical protein
MMTLNSTSWRNVCANHWNGPSPPGFSADGSPRNASPANRYAHHIEPTNCVTSSANFSLNVVSPAAPCLKSRGVGCNCRSADRRAFSGDGGGMLNVEARRLRIPITCRARAEPI